MGGSGRGQRPGGEERAAAGGEARVATIDDHPVDDRLAAAAAELYGADPDSFTQRRKELAATAKAAGDKVAAGAIAALRKPTRAAWVVNRLARADPAAPARLTALADGLRAAEQQKDGLRLRELSAERGAVIDALTAQALAAASVTDPPTSLREEVAGTLTAAFADPATAAEFAAGTLTKAAHWSGFGALGLGLAGGADTGGSANTGDRAASDDSRNETASASGGESSRTAGPSRSARQGVAAVAGVQGDADTAQGSGMSKAPGRARSQAERWADAPPDAFPGRRAAQQQRAAEERQATEERRAAEAEQRRTREAAERAAERRKNYEDMERTVASAAAAAAEAGATEERLEGEVRDLEERLIQAKADLAKARLRARHAEAAERRASQTLDRMPRP